VMVMASSVSGALSRSIAGELIFSRYDLRMRRPQEHRIEVDLVLLDEAADPRPPRRNRHARQSIAEVPGRLSDGATTRGDRQRVSGPA
jgi:hypothetical protein